MLQGCFWHRADSGMLDMCMCRCVHAYTHRCITTCVCMHYAYIVCTYLTTHMHLSLHSQVHTQRHIHVDVCAGGGALYFLGHGPGYPSSEQPRDNVDVNPPFGKRSLQVGLLARNFSARREAHWLFASLPQPSWTT